MLNQPAEIQRHISRALPRENVWGIAKKMSKVFLQL
jgi:hypothetical protein